MDEDGGASGALAYAGKIWHHAIAITHTDILLTRVRGRNAVSEKNFMSICLLRMYCLVIGCQVSGRGFGDNPGNDPGLNKKNTPGSYRG